jgi:hypothetical protein
VNKRLKASMGKTEKKSAYKTSKESNPRSEATSLMTSDGSQGELGDAEITTVNVNNYH